jgi:hypothetical protein
MTIVNKTCSKKYEETIIKKRAYLIKKNEKYRKECLEIANRYNTKTHYNVGYDFIRKNELWIKYINRIKDNEVLIEKLTEIEKYNDINVNRRFIKVVYNK